MGVEREAGRCQTPRVKAISYRTLIAQLVCIHCASSVHPFRIRSESKTGAKRRKRPAQLIAGRARERRKRGCRSRPSGLLATLGGTLCLPGGLPSIKPCGPLESVPVSMICPPNVRRSTIAAQRRGSGNVFDQPENASFEAIASEFFTDVAPCVEDRADRGFSAGVGSRIGRGGRCNRAVATLPPIIRERTIFRPCYAPPSDMDVTVRVEQPSGAACPAKRSSTQRRAAGVALIARLTCSLVWSRV